MPKIIIAKEQIIQDPHVALIKAFRVANKRAGEYARVGDNINYVRKLQHLGALQNQAESELGFHIWVNANGNTGHTHTHDYKESRDSDNDYGMHLLVINRVEGEFANDSTFGFPKERPAAAAPSKFDFDNEIPDNEANEWDDDDDRD